MANLTDAESPSLRLLLVDDRRDVLIAGGRLLEISGFHVTVAPNGAIALRKARETRPDIIVTDLAMPEATGEELCQKLREDSTTRSIHVLVYTAVTDASALAAMVRLGVRVFAIKPCLPSIVAQEARALVEHPAAVPRVRIVTGFGESLDDLAQDVLRQS